MTHSHTTEETLKNCPSSKFINKPCYRDLGANTWSSKQTQLKPQKTKTATLSSFRQSGNVSERFQSSHCRPTYVQHVHPQRPGQPADAPLTPALAAPAAPAGSEGGGRVKGSGVGKMGQKMATNPELAGVCWNAHHWRHFLHDSASVLREKIEVRERFSSDLLSYLRSSYLFPFRSPQTK